MTQVATPTGNITYQYDPTTHRLTSETDINGKVTQYAYDPASGALTSITQVASTGNAVTQEMYDRLGNLALVIAPDGNRTAFRTDALGRPTATIEDDGVSPTGDVTEQITSATTMSVNVSASEPILVASLQYWQDGLAQTAAVTQSMRLDDKTAFSFNVTGIDTTHRYHYQLTLTDRVGLSQTLPQALLDAATLFAVSAPTAATAGIPFLVTVTAKDGSGHTAVGYSGIVQLTSAGGNAVLPANATLSNGFGAFLVTLKTVAGGPWSVTAQDTLYPTITGTSGNITLSPGAAGYFTVTVSGGTLTTGSSTNVTVTAYDQFGNIATGYGGHVHFSSTDAAASLPIDSTLTSGVGTFSVGLNTAGSQTITVTDTMSANATITGTSTLITARGLTVTSFMPTATGFTASFSKPFLPADLTLYGTGQHTVQDVTLNGAHVGPINGSLLINPLSMSITFNATANGLSLLNGFNSVVLPDDTYIVTIVSGSGSNGFLDALGAGLDGANNAGHANFTTTFTTHYQANATPVLSIPDFARGPDNAHAVKVPNDTGFGIPITLYHALNVTDVTFRLSYNPALLNVTAGFSGTHSDGTDPAGSFTMAPPVIIDATHATADFHFRDSTPQSLTVVLGDIQATVPDSAASNYKAKELLSISNVVINGGAIKGAVSAGGVHVNAYFGDVTGNGTIDGLDVATAFNVAQGKDTGFAAYQLLDPAVVGDISIDYSVDAGDVSQLAAYTVHLPRAVIPPIPTGLTITPVGADPTLSLGEPQRQGDTVIRRQGDSSFSPGHLVTLSPGHLVSVPVLLDQPHPAGSTGMTEAVLALTYDPSVLSVSAADITLGSIPGLGTGWQISSVVDAATGQIGIELYSTTPIAATLAGSLVNIAFHLQAGERPGLSRPWNPATTVQLVNRVMANGQQFTTQVDDAQGQFVLSPGSDRWLLEPASGSLVMAAPAGLRIADTLHCYEPKSARPAQISPKRPGLICRDWPGGQLGWR